MVQHAVSPPGLSTFTPYFFKLNDFPRGVDKVFLSLGLILNSFL